MLSQVCTYRHSSSSSQGGFIVAWFRWLWPTSYENLEALSVDTKMGCYGTKVMSDGSLFPHFFTGGFSSFGFLPSGRFMTNSCLLCFSWKSLLVMSLSICRHFYPLVTFSIILSRIIFLSIESCRGCVVSIGVCAAVLYSRCSWSHQR